MRITTKGRYALRAITQLAKSYAGQPISIKELSKTEDISPEFLEQIFFKLRKAGIISSTRGPGGGFSLEKDPKEITIHDLFSAVGEGIELTPCSGEEECEKAEECLTHSLWKDASAHFQEYFSGITVDDVLHKRVSV
ncbi:MAG: Rrf2 family transcriptional regulator [Spirochaetales bacterium]|nr:Rrf2 family transcriptional regulator [Spirochaetales bacterium]